MTFGQRLLSARRSRSERIYIMSRRQRPPALREDPLILANSCLTRPPYTLAGDPVFASASSLSSNSKPLVRGLWLRVYQR